MKSTIKNYNEDKGFGFVDTEFDMERRADLRSADAFVHVSKLKNVPEPYYDRSIEFDVEETAKGLVAVNIRDNQAEYLEEEALRKLQDEERAERRKIKLEELLTPIEEAILEDLTFAEISAFRADIEEAYDYTYGSTRIEALETQIEDLWLAGRRQVQIEEGIAATELKCLTCAETKPKADFEQDKDQELRDGHSISCAVCTEIETNKRQVALDNISVSLKNLETIKKKQLKDLVRSIFAVENKNWSDEMDKTNRQVISTIICYGDHSVGYFIPNSLGPKSYDFKISGGKCFSISKWRSKKGNYCSSLQHYRIQGSIDDNFENIKNILIQKLNEKEL